VKLPTALDLFAGAGGATQGLRNAGYRVVGAVENDAAAAGSYRLNHPDVDLRCIDIREIDPARFRSDLKLQRGMLTLLKACPPCQGFSTLGAHDRDDERNDLVREVWRFVREFLPAAVIVENVRGIGRDPRFALMTRQMRGIGYRIRQYTIDAADFGVPQHRERLIVIAVRVGGSLPVDISEALPPDFSVARMSAGEALESIADLTEATDALHRGRRLAPLTEERIRAIPVGGGRFNLPAGLQLACHSSVGRSAASPYGRVRLEDPAPTMTTRCTTPACGRFIHPTEHRGLTLREAAVFQTFPVTYTFTGNYGQIERQIGNAVPVRLAEALGLVVTRTLAKAIAGPRARASS